MEVVQQQVHLLQINVTADPTVSVATSNTELCDGGIATFTATVLGGNGAVSYQWQINDDILGFIDIPGEDANVFTTDPLSPDVYSYQVIVTQNNGCEVISAPSVVTVLSDPVVTIFADDLEFCDGGSVSLTSTTTGGSGINTYQWQMDDGVSGWQDISGATFDSHIESNLNEGFYDFRLQLTQGEGCSDQSNTLTVSVVADPTVTISIDDASICEGAIATLTATVNGGAGTDLFQWE